MENHVIPEFGRIRLDGLTVARLETYYGVLASERGLASQTVRNHRMALQAAFNDAERWAIIRRESNPAEISRVPPVRTGPRRTLSVAQICRVLEDPSSGRLHALFVLNLQAVAGAHLPVIGPGHLRINRRRD